MHIGAGSRHREGEGMKAHMENPSLTSHIAAVADKLQQSNTYRRPPGRRGVFSFESATPIRAA